MDAPELTVVIPLLDEEPNVRTTVRAVVDMLATAAPSAELLLVDDGSTDGTWREITAVAAELELVRAVRFTRNFGKESAIRAGLEHARGRAVLVMDADLQHPVDLVPRMLERMRATGADIVEGVKASRGRESGLRRSSARLFYWLLHRLSGWDLSGSSDFKLLSRRAVEAVLSMRERNAIFRGLATWTGYKVERIPFEVPERAGGASKFGYLRLIRLALGAVTSFSSKPLQLVTTVAVLFALFAIALTARALYLWWLGRAVEGFTTVIIADLVIGSCIMFSLGLVGVYLAQIYDELKGRPSYLTVDTIRVDGRRERT